MSLRLFFLKFCHCSEKVDEYNKYISCTRISVLLLVLLGFPDSSDGKASTYNVGDPGLIPGLGRSPGEGNGNPLQYSCLENPRD